MNELARVPALILSCVFAGCAARPPADAASRIMGGDMVYMADAAIFTDCRTGQRLPMAMEADFVRLQRAYLGNVRTPGTALFVTFEGSIAQRPSMEGAGTQPSVIVSNFIHTWPNQNCERSRADAALLNTYWRIVNMLGEPVSAVEGRREPHLVLGSADQQQRLTATVGCNQFMGGYAVTGEQVTFSAVAGTKMACPPPLNTLEQRLLEVLHGARRWRVFGNTLEFADSVGARTALFEAVHLP